MHARVCACINACVCERMAPCMYVLMHMLVHTCEFAFVIL